MKKNKRLPIIIAAALAAILLSVIFIPKVIKSAKNKSIAAQQNYVAAKLIELGDHDEGYSLALETDTFYPNKISKELITVAYGFCRKLDTGTMYANACLEVEKDEIISGLCELYEQMIADPNVSCDSYGTYSFYGDTEESYRLELLDELKKIQNSIKVKKSGAAIQAMVDMYSSNYNSSDAVKELENDDSPTALRLKTVYALNFNDYDTALEEAQKLVSADDSFVNRAFAANIIAHTEIASIDSGSSLEKKLKEKLELEEKLEKELTKLGADHSELDDLKLENKKLKELSDQIDKLENDISTESVRRAINYIEETATAEDKKTGAYSFERAYLYYKAGEEDQAKKLFELMIGQLGNKTQQKDSVSMIISSICSEYQKNSALSSRYTINEFIKNIASVLGFDRWYEYGDNNGFCNLFMEALDSVYRSIIVRSVDASDFPTVRMTVNVSDSFQKNFKAGNLQITDTDGKTKDIKVKSYEKVSDDIDVSIMLVVDTSGSMGGDPITDTKKAVREFVNGLSEDIPIGLVRFSGDAELRAPLDVGHRNLLIELDKLEAHGNTWIAGGLDIALNSLKGESGRRVIILLSDGMVGDDNSMDSITAEIKREGITLYAIGIEGADSVKLTSIANACGGKYVEARSTEMLTEIYASIGNSMVNDYILEYCVTDKLEEFDRDFEIVLKKSDAFAIGQYNVGVKAEDIEDGDDTKYFGMFRQIGEK